MKPYFVIIIDGHLIKSSNIFIINFLQLRVTTVELAWIFKISKQKQNSVE